MFADYENDEFKMDDEMSQEEIINAKQLYNSLVDRLVRENYESIAKNGIDIVNTKIHNLEPKQIEQLRGTLDFMIVYFTELEEYEKCAVLHKYVEELNQ
jgi:uncharacterized Fe-S cluster-containing radical SAM superfamily enzyme